MHRILQWTYSMTSPSNAFCKKLENTAIFFWIHRKDTKGRVITFDNLLIGEQTRNKCTIAMKVPWVTGTFTKWKKKWSQSLLECKAKLRISFLFSGKKNAIFLAKNFRCVTTTLTNKPNDLSTFLCIIVYVVPPHFLITQKLTSFKAVMSACSARKIDKQIDKCKWSKMIWQPWLTSYMGHVWKWKFILLSQSPGHSTLGKKKEKNLYTRTFTSHFGNQPAFLVQDEPPNPR